MREIKFRAWKPHNSLSMKPGLYLVSDIVWYDEPFQGNTGEVFYKGYKTSDYLEDVKIMQYTGLKDRAGKEIYEGDILRTWRGSGWKGGLSAQTKLLVVAWREAQNGIGFNVGVGPNNRREVIGNTYQNPKLAGGAKL